VQAGYEKKSQAGELTSATEHLSGLKSRLNAECVVREGVAVREHLEIPIVLRRLDSEAPQDLHDLRTRQQLQSPYLIASDNTQCVRYVPTFVDLEEDETFLAGSFLEIPSFLWAQCRRCRHH
jgi:hypothetical protein